jgi:hypothetical protein
VKLTNHVHLRSMLRIREAKSPPYPFVSVARSLKAHAANSFIFLTIGVNDRVRDEELK